MITLGEDVLDRAWAAWNIKYSANTFTPYSRVSRRSPFAQQFEMLLFKEGAIVQRINKKCYLQFTDPEEALMFRLRYV